MKKAVIFAGILSLAALTACGGSESSENKDTTTVTTTGVSETVSETTTTEATTTSASETVTEADTTTTSAALTEEPEVTTSDSGEEPPKEKKAVELEGNKAGFEHFALEFEYPEGWDLSETGGESDLLEGTRQDRGISLNVQTSSYDGEVSLDDYIERLEQVYNELISEGAEGDPMAIKNLAFSTEDTEHGGVKGKKHMTTYEQGRTGKVCIYEFVYPDDDSTELLFFTYYYSGEGDADEVKAEIEGIME